MLGRGRGGGERRRRGRLCGESIHVVGGEVRLKRKRKALDAAVFQSDIGCFDWGGNQTSIGS